MNATGEELVNLIVAAERVRGLIGPLRMLSDNVDEIREVAPELGPELAALELRISEAADHAIAAQAVLTARLGLLGEGR